MEILNKLLFVMVRWDKKNTGGMPVLNHDARRDYCFPFALE